MSAPIADFQSGRNCKRCGSELSPGALSCNGCNTLVHAVELESIAARAKQLENEQQYELAREEWAKTLDLLPQDSKQWGWVKNHVDDLQSTAKLQVAEPERQWLKKLGPLGPVLLLLVKGKGLFALFNAKFLVSFFAFFGVYWSLYGAVFGVGLTLLILVHEMGHYLEVKRRGLPADMPVFLPGLGAYVRWQALGVSLETRAAVSLAGPLAGLLASITCAVIWWSTGNALWGALARLSAGLNILNLIPVWALDGGQAAHALNKAERIVLLSACILLAMVLSQGIFLLVAGGAAYRLFTKDLAEHPSRPITIYYIVVLALLGITMKLIPGTGLGGL